MMKVEHLKYLGLILCKIVNKSQELEEIKKNKKNQELMKSESEMDVRG